MDTHCGARNSNGHFSLTGSDLPLLYAITAWFFPLSREKHTRIRELLDKRKERGELPDE